MYLPSYGKFAQVDPAYDQAKDDPETWNLYNYVTNNPVTHTDPDGRADAKGTDGFPKNEPEPTDARQDRLHASHSGAEILSLNSVTFEFPLDVCFSVQIKTRMSTFSDYSSICKTQSNMNVVKNALHTSHRLSSVQILLSSLVLAMPGKPVSKASALMSDSQDPKQMNNWEDIANYYLRTCPDFKTAWQRAVCDRGPDGSKDSKKVPLAIAEHYLYALWRSSSNPLEKYWMYLGVTCYTPIKLLAYPLGLADTPPSLTEMKAGYLGAFHGNPIPVSVGSTLIP